MADPLNIEITYNGSGEGISIGDVKPSIVFGFGLHQAWMLAVMFGSERAFSNGSEHNLYLTSLFFTISLVAYMATLFIRSVLDGKGTGGLFSRRMVIVVGALNAGATLSILGLGLPQPLGWACLLLGGITSGVASGSMILFWGGALAETDIPSIVINSVLAFATGTVLYSLVLHPLAYPVSTLATVALPLVESGLLLKVHDSRKKLEDPEFQPTTLPMKKSALALRICPPMLIFGVATGLFGQSSLHKILSGPEHSDQILVMAGVALTALALIILFLMMRFQSLNFMYRPLLPLTAASLLLVPLTSNGSPLVSLGLLAGFLCLDAILWITPCEMCSRYRISPLLMFGFSRGGLAAGTFLVDIAQRLHELSTGLPLELTRFDVIAVILVALMVGYMLLPREHDLKAWSEASEKSNSSEMAQPPAPLETAPQQGGDFMAKCRAIANKNLLTGKETEVLFLLAKGRNAACIQERMFISENTVRTHMRHIYRKLGVHTQQELIDLVDKASEIDNHDDWLEER